LPEKYAENIRKNKDIAAFIAASISDTIWMIPFDPAEESFVSQSVYPLLGYQPDEFLVLNPSQVFNEESLEMFRQVIDYFREIRFPLRDNGEPQKYARIFEFRMIHSSAETIWVEASVNIYCAATGEPLGVLMALRDVSRRKKLEEDYTKQLNKQVELNNFKSQVISTISHEFRTPISVIYSNLQLLKKFRYNLDQSIQNDAFELTTMAIHSLSKTLDNLALLNQSNKGVLGFEMQDVQLIIECEKIATEISSIQQNQGRILTKFDFPDISVKTDNKLLHHILSNLLVNGLKFSPEGKPVEFTVRQNGDLVEFRIKDEGIGIPDDELSQVFESFYRGSNTRGIKGTGLGLSIVKRCVDLLKGNINIISKLDKGTEVIVNIPYERSEQ